MKKYTLNQIKKAFWEQFHKSGELWFNYLGTDKENENSTQKEWDEFAKGLDKISPNQSLDADTKYSGNPDNNPRKDVDIFHAPML